jgi:excinuclease ABC subunit B
MYADKITFSMQKTIDETLRRRIKQMAYNEEHGITPRTIIKSTDSIMGQTSVASHSNRENRNYRRDDENILAADPVVQYMTKEALQKAIQKARKSMEEAVKELDFVEAARYRDEIFGLEKVLNMRKAEG